MKDKKEVKKRVVKKPVAKQVKVKPAIKPVKKKEKTAETEAVAVARFGLHNIKVPYGAHKSRKVRGRGPGSGHGKTACRGHKGQRSRAGRDFYLGFEGGQMPLIRRVPKRGFTSKFKKEYQIVNIKDLERIDEKNISLGLLQEKGLIKNSRELVKILGEGEIKGAVVIQAHAFSKNAIEKITGAGGKAEIVK